MTKVQRVEKHIIKKANPHYQLIDGFCFCAKNLYNHANYIIRQEFIENGKWIRYNSLDKLLRADMEYPDYRNMPTAQSAQQLLKMLDKNWQSFFKSIKDWTKHKDKYLGKPNLPKYKNKSGRCVLTLTNQEVHFRDGLLQFPKVFDRFVIKPYCVERKDFVSFQQVRFMPKSNYIVAEVVYTVEIPDTKSDNNRYLSIDIGVDNLTTVTNNFGEQPFIINGKGLKSINVYYNKKVSHYQEIAKRMNNLDYTNQMYAITEKRNRKVEDYLHKTSRIIADYANSHNVSVIVIGKNKNWKQSVNLGRKNNQKFTELPFARLIGMIQYKAEGLGIQVVLTEESYTSGTSFLDNELPIAENYNKSRRRYRGLFISDSDQRINADVNGSLQIMKKVFPNAFADGVEAVALQPLVVNASAV